MDIFFTFLYNLYILIKGGIYFMRKQKERNSALDIIRIFALLCVISVHFFLNNGFYSQPMAGKRMFIMTIMRTSFMVCVPLFITLTGYLMNKKSLSKKYYFGIIKTIGIYILASIACIIFKYFYLNIDYSFISAIKSILNFSAANYSWYIEMYIGLFLLIPFLNILYNNIPSKKDKKALIITLLTLTSIPCIINIYNFNNFKWWINPSSSNVYDKIIPSWWTGIYPLTFYFIGCYLKDFKITIKKELNILLIIVLATLSGAFNYYRSYGSTFISGPYQDWGSILNVILTSLVFILLLNINISETHNKLKKLLAKLSDLCLGGYLVSYIFDQIFYLKLNTLVPEMLNRLNYFIIIVPVIFICSISLSYIINLIYKFISLLLSNIYKQYFNKL